MQYNKSLCTDDEKLCNEIGFKTNVYSHIMQKLLG